MEKTIQVDNKSITIDNVKRKTLTPKTKNKLFNSEAFNFKDSLQMQNLHHSKFRNFEYPKEKYPKEKSFKNQARNSRKEVEIPRF